MAGVDPSSYKSTTYTTHSSEETFTLGVQLGKSLQAGSIVCFFGDLGAGKTTMIKGIVSGAGSASSSEVTSPTFTYLHVYKGPKTIYHFDLYRLPSEDEFVAMGFDEYFDAGGVCCIEWSEKIPSLVKENTMRIDIEHLGGDSRNIRITQ